MWVAECLICHGCRLALWFEMLGPASISTEAPTKEERKVNHEGNRGKMDANEEPRIINRTRHVQMHEIANRFSKQSTFPSRAAVAKHLCRPMDILPSGVHLCKPAGFAALSALSQRSTVHGADLNCVTSDCEGQICTAGNEPNAYDSGHLKGVTWIGEVALRPKPSLSSVPCRRPLGPTLYVPFASFGDAHVG